MLKPVVLFALVLSACTRGGAPDMSAYRAEGATTRLCNNPALIGERLDDIVQGQCRITNPVAVHAIGNVQLLTPATLNCNTANTLADWVQNDAQNAVSRLRTRITGIKVLASYACRTRNNQPGARLSEHALGNAIDIAGFTLANGGEVSVQYDWRAGGKKGAVVRQLFATACNRFGTVLGPDADRFHYNHFHVDTAEYRSGSYCR